MSGQLESMDEERRISTHRSDTSSNLSAGPDNPVGVSLDQIHHLFEVGKTDIFSRDSTSNHILNVATLQRLVLVQLQLKIIEKSSPIVRQRLGHSNPLDDDALKKALTDYAQAVRDWELMVDYSNRANGDIDKDPFCISSKWALPRYAMAKAGFPNQLDQTDSYHHGRLDQYTGIFNQRNRMIKDRSWKAFIVRFSMALFGGIALIGPMLLMVLHKDTTTDLTTTSVSVFLVAIIISIYSTATPEGILGTIAAYAAVLVVFVGTLQGN